jgi:hypothetical protein
MDIWRFGEIEGSNSFRSEWFVVFRLYNSFNGYVWLVEPTTPGIFGWYRTIPTGLTMAGDLKCEDWKPNLRTSGAWDCSQLGWFDNSLINVWIVDDHCMIWSIHDHWSVDGHFIYTVHHCPKAMATLICIAAMQALNAFTSARRGTRNDCFFQ